MKLQVGVYKDSPGTIFIFLGWPNFVPKMTPKIYVIQYSLWCKNGVKNLM